MRRGEERLRYDTPIPYDQLFAYNKWLREQSRNASRPVGLDQRDYDVQGMFMGGGSFDGGHGPDYYKKPNHPTFSDESIYHNTPSKPADAMLRGGHWNADGSFTPGETNLQYHTPMQLMEYFQQCEPGVRLTSPNNSALGIANFLLQYGGVY